MARVKTTKRRTILRIEVSEAGLEEIRRRAAKSGGGVTVEQMAGSLLRYAMFHAAEDARTWDAEPPLRAALRQEAEAVMARSLRASRRAAASMTRRAWRDTARRLKDT